MLMSIIIIMSDRNVIFAQPIVTYSFLGLYFFVFLVLVFPVVFYVRWNSYCFLSNRILVSLVWVSRGRSYWVNKLFMLKSLIHNVSKKESLIYKLKKKTYLYTAAISVQWPVLLRTTEWIRYIRVAIVECESEKQYFLLPTPYSGFPVDKGK